MAAPGVGFIASFPEVRPVSAGRGTGRHLDGARRLLGDSGRDIALARPLQGAGVPCDGVKAGCGGLPLTCWTEQYVVAVRRDRRDDLP